MKPHVVNILKVCGITLFFLSPALGVLAIVWHHHTGFVQTQQAIAYGLNNPSEPMLSSSLVMSLMPPAQACSTTFYNAGFPSSLMLSKVETMIHAVLGIGVLGAFSYALGVALYKRYRGYRIAVVREQVERLERLWQQEHC
ncbi:MAG: hypothetical protein SFY66_11685 [Oculatellaceae cyanobacterium bins.114]|nr:hypothetical protein [Oculatellaceae cyanobacterium bins.114]